jgi:V/A-type H+-transporting ATPase subunit E
MAGIENLKNRILKDDSEKAREIEGAAAIKAEGVIADSKNKAAELFEDIKIKAEKDGIDKRERIISRAQLDARNIVLEAKQNSIDNVLNLAAQKIKTMNKQEYSLFLEKFLLNSVESGKEEVIFSAKDRDRFDSDLIETVNMKLKGMGRTGELKLSTEYSNISSGFILKSGGLEINCSIESQIRILRDELEGEIAALLFEGK